jgi:hypothetical protein
MSVALADCGLPKRAIDVPLESVRVVNVLDAEVAEHTVKLREAHVAKGRKPAKPIRELVEERIRIELRPQLPSEGVAERAEYDVAVDHHD